MSEGRLTADLPRGADAAAVVAAASPRSTKDKAA